MNDSSLLFRSNSVSERSSSSRCSRCCRACCVPFKGAILVLVWSALLHSSALSLLAIIYMYLYAQLNAQPEAIIIYWEINSSFFNFTVIPRTMSVPTSLVPTAMIVTLLLYPVAGLLAEVRFTRFKFMICGTVVVMVGLVIAAIGGGILFFLANTNKATIAIHICITVLLTIGVIIHNFGLGMFEANAIQFGVDQLQFASNEELSKFIHWYFWTLFVVQYTLITLPNAIIIFRYTVHLLLFPQSVFALICCVIALLMVSCCNRRHHLFIIEPTTHNNPVKLIVKVMNYVRQHSQPVRRSAFTYGEAIPTRLDLAKERYGGTFTTEQVEDVKSFWRITGLLLTLFGLSLTTDMFMALGIDLFYHRLWYTYFEFISANLILSQSLHYTVIIIGIPFYMCLLRPCLRHHLPSMLKKMAIGLLMICITLTLTTVSSSMIYSREHEPFVYYNSSSDDTIFEFSLLLVAQLFSGVGYILVFLTALEFILAQAPRNMQGVLIGLWYAYQSIGVAIHMVNILNINHFDYWPYIVKAVFAVISFLLYIIVSYRFKYRQREESSNTNYQSIIEDYTLRQLESEQEMSMDMSSSEEYIVIED